MSRPAVPESMRAIAVRPGKSDAGALSVSSAPVPELHRGEILIRVQAAGVNRADLLQRQGLYPPPPGASEILGLEVAGNVAAVARGVKRWKVGDAVTALLPGGGYAEYVAVDARHALPIPRGMDFVHAAALPETTFTVWTNVFEGGRLRKGETLLVHGANSGIGVTAIQMAKAAGARVFATARGEGKARRARSLGADLAIDASSGDWAGAIEAAGGANVVLDMVGVDYFQRNLQVLAYDGRLVQIASVSGRVAQLDLYDVMRKRLTVTGSGLRNRSANEKARLAREVEKKVWPWIRRGKLRPLVDKRFPLERAPEAHQRLETGSQFGKVILTVG
jgi:NADPH:quinone reductase